MKIREPILCLRRVLIDRVKERVREAAPHTISIFESLVGEYWLQSAQTARNASVSINFLNLFKIAYDLILIFFLT